jgi:hypothetical protein
MKSFLRKQSISLKSLVITLLLSFIGQAVALPDVCTMAQSESIMKNVMLNESLTKSVSIQQTGTLPCHSMSMTMTMTMSQGLPPSPDNQMAMDCCDSPTMADSSCSCPDDGCSASFPFSNQNITGMSSYSEHRNYYPQPGFPRQVNSALFRPPIA